MDALEEYLVFGRTGGADERYIFVCGELLVRSVRHLDHFLQVEELVMDAEGASLELSMVQQVTHQEH